MTVKSKIRIGFGALLLIVIFLIGMAAYVNKLHMEVAQEINGVYFSTQTFRVIFNNSVSMQSDLYYRIINNLPIPEDTTWKRQSCVKLHQVIFDWYSEFIKKPEYNTLSQKQKQAYRDMLPAVKATREAISDIRKTNNKRNRLAVYTNKFDEANQTIQNKLKELIDENFIHFISKSKEQEFLSKNINKYLVIIVVITLFCIIIIYVFSNFVLRPIGWLTDGVKRMKEGNLNFKIRRVSTDELGRLTKMINEMNEEITSHRERLEDLVNDRTTQMSSMNTKLVSTLSELQTTNKQLVEARRVADMDMQMAVNVQKSFLDKQAPFSEEWDIAFIFKPMSGVSGDMYDFYTDNDGKLLGLSLMDISGHGISSGLLSMIAKSVAQRNFNFGHENALSLNKTIVKMNSELIAELKNIDNYLTGIILKFQDDVIEYVNAGHPDIIIRKYDKGRSFVVAPTEREYKGKFLGVEPMHFDEKEIRSLKFRVHEGDVLCLYTDCLNESTNKEGDEFGIEGIIATLNSADASYSAQDILNHLVSSFYRWVGSDELKDDFSVIIVRRKIR